MTVKTQQINFDLLLKGYMFRLLRVIIRPSNEPTQDYLIPSALWDPVVLTIALKNIKKSLLALQLLFLLYLFIHYSPLFKKILLKT